MKAVILVGGEGTRLRPLTCNIPKPMVPIVNRPFLEYMIEHLRSHQITDIILALGYLPDRIQRYFGDGEAFGVRLTYVVEERPLGTAGAVRNVAEHLGETCFVFNGDVLTDLDLSAMLRFHREKGAKVTIALTPVEDPTIYGVVDTDAHHRVLRFIEKPSWDAVTTNLINAGIYILEPEVMEQVPPYSFYMFEHGLFPQLLRLGAPVYGYPNPAYWMDIGTPEKYLLVHQHILSGKITTRLPGQPLGPGLWVEEGVEIHPTARLSGVVVVGKNCRVGPGARLLGPVVLGEGSSVGPDSVVEEAVIWRRVRIGAQAVLKGCVLADDSAIGDQVWLLHGPIIGDGAVVGSGNRLERGLKLWPGKHLEDGAITF